ncbi:hypothetical protein VTK56DRAFT_5710 [Thermocarpiscus australiensis]
MTASSSAPEAGRVPGSTGASYTRTLAHNSSAANNNKSSDSSVFHAHRQNHNSSKLPAFRFADLKREPIALPSLQQHSIPPSPVSPRGTTDSLDENQRNAHEQRRQVPGSSGDSLHNHHNNARNLSDKPASSETQQPAARFSRTRSLKFHLPTAPTPADPSTGSKRPASFPDTPKVYATRAQPSYVAPPATKRRLTASGPVQDAAAPTPPRPQLSSTRLRGPEPDEPDEASRAQESAIKESIQGKREIQLPRTIEIAKSEDKRKSRPPVSYKTSNAATPTGGRAVIPPIRSFRSSGSRKSVVLDMHTRRESGDSFSEEITDPNQRDRTLQALEGRSDEDFSHLAPPDSGDMTTTTDNDNTADIFMRIAGEDTTRRAPEEQGPAADLSAVSRIARAAHRRPLSAAIPSYQAPSPPQISRRLSDQRDNARARQAADTQQTQQATKELAYRAAAVRENPPTISTAPEDPARAQPVRTPLKPSPITPRQISFQESFAESSFAYQRRRQSVTESNNHSAARTTQYRGPNPALSQARTYNPSPLVPRSSNIQKDDPHHVSEANQAAEGTESSASTAAPSTVWDELDDLKSRIYRLELTGKMQSTSGAAVSKTSDERPPTATTNATTVSASPKRGAGTGPAQADANSKASLSRETQPLLLSALSKTKGLVSSEVFSAIESAATDALALSSMIGPPGQPGPISSAASTIGYNGGVTDRQLRRKADSICRSLTELCIALADETGQRKQSLPTVVTPAATHEKEVSGSPTSTKPTAATSQRRPSAIADAVAKPDASPRAPTSLEQRRQILLASSGLSSPRYAAAPGTPLDPMSAGRKSSLLLARIRRAGTEEPEAPSGRRSSLLLRTRRAGTEEPEENHEGRKTSLLLRTRKTMDEEEDESRFRAPSRAITEVNSFRAGPRDLSSSAQSPPEDSQPADSALPRRRLVPSSLNTRIVTVSASSAPVTPARRYLERTTSEREPSTVAGKVIAEDRMQRQISLSQSALLNRTASVARRTMRESGIPSLSPSSAAQNAQSAGGGYR